MNRIKASVAQLNYLSEHMKGNPCMASGNLRKDLQERANLAIQWQKLADKLNSLGGPIKSPSKWKQAWRDLRNNHKKKASYSKSELRGYGIGSTVNSSVAVNGVDEVVTAEIKKSPARTQSSSMQPIPAHRQSMGSLSVLSASETGSWKCKRRRQVIREESFDTKLLKLQEENLKLKKERNAIEERRNCIAEEKNAALNRIADILEKMI